MSPRFRLIRIPLLAFLACLALAALAASDSGAVSPIQRSARSCAPPKYPGSGYFTGKIRATNISCAYAKKFVVAYYRCRTRSGKTPAGRCRARVQGFRCVERPRNQIDTEIDARVTCKRGTQRIVHTYQQNLD